MAQNDYGSVMMEENVVSAAGTSFRLTVEEIRRSISELGYEAPAAQQLVPVAGLNLPALVSLCSRYAIKLAAHMTFFVIDSHTAHRFAPGR